MQSSIVKHVISPMRGFTIRGKHLLYNELHKLTLLQEQNMYKFTPVRLEQLQGCKL